jgi:hypothetical protein
VGFLIKQTVQEGLGLDGRAKSKGGERRPTKVKKVNSNKMKRLE